MRITGGTGRGRRLKVPAGEKVRPTSDKVKQALFNILGDRVPGSSFLDLFAGAGGVGIEALSRGAERVVFVDGDRESLDVVKHNIEQAGFDDQTEAVLSKVEPFLKKRSGPYDIVFLDPPYSLEIVLSWIMRASALLFAAASMDLMMYSATTGVMGASILISITVRPGGAGAVVVGADRCAFG